MAFKKNQQDEGGSIEWRDLALAIVFAVLGFFFTTKFFVMFLNGLNPAVGMILVFVVVSGAIALLSKLDLIVLGFRWDGFQKFIGWALITFSFYIIISNSSCLQNTLVYGSGACDKVSNIYFQTPDGAIFYLWSRLIPIATNFGFQMVRLLTYCVTPGLLAFLGGSMVKGKQQLDGI